MPKLLTPTMATRPQAEPTKSGEPGRGRRRRLSHLVALATINLSWDNGIPSNGRFAARWLCVEEHEKATLEGELAYEQQPQPAPRTPSARAVMLGRTRRISSCCDPKGVISRARQSFPCKSPISNGSQWGPPGSACDLGLRQTRPRRPLESRPATRSARRELMPWSGDGRISPRNYSGPPRQPP
jgi:hypothetical protein